LEGRLIPIENEKKILIHESAEKIIAEQAEQTLYMEQKYLVMEKGLSVRVRSIVNGDITYWMTLKKDVKGQCVEVECPIDKEDFTKLWSTAYNRVVKVRYLFEGWEIDFFKRPDNSNYIAIAEIEMLPTQKEPHVIPELIAAQIIFSIPLSDRRFSSKKLGNIKYATELLESVKKTLILRS
jgi:CYTH domain-containing protein